MSSEIEGVGLIAAAVVLPAAAALGAGWLAWQGGRLLVEAAANVDRKAEELRRREQEAARNRKNAALQAHEQLTAMCRSAIGELEASGGAGDVQAMKQELLQVCSASVPQDTGAIEQLNLRGMAVLERIVSRQRKLADTGITGSGAYNGAALGELMGKLRVAVEAASVTAMQGADVQAADPQVLERVRLNGKLTEVSARVMTALEFVVDLGENYGISDANNAWFQSCFNGVDLRIRELCSPAVSNQELKQGIRALEEIMKQYDMLYPTMEREKGKLAALYPVYAQAAEALGEPVYQLRHFKSASALEAEMHRLEERSRKAQQCAEIYRKLGPAAYLCYAWDQELKAMGYSVHSRKQITEMANHKPDRAKLGDAEMPFYRWDEKGLTQLYSVDPACDLQLIVHPDGTTTMETIGRSEEREQVTAVQKKHCAAVEALHRRLMENWFISYKYEETEDAEAVQTLAAWRGSEDNTWSRAAAAQTGVRENLRTGKTQKTMEKQ